jgi:hypothetical protein
MEPGSSGSEVVFALGCVVSLLAIEDVWDVAKVAMWWRYLVGGREVVGW